METRMRVRVWREQDEWVASADECLVHAFGATRKEALVELKVEMDGQYRYLVGLGPDRVSPKLYATVEPLRRALGLDDIKGRVISGHDYATT